MLEGDLIKETPCPRKATTMLQRVPNKCYHCPKEGHIRRFCPERQKKKNTTQGKKTSEAEVAADDYDSSKALVVSESEARNEWILDLGCSFHMSPHKDWFESLKKTLEGSVLLRNNKACKVL